MPSLQTVFFAATAALAGFASAAPAFPADLAARDGGCHPCSTVSAILANANARVHVVAHDLKASIITAAHPHSQANATHANSGTPHTTHSANVTTRAEDETEHTKGQSETHAQNGVPHPNNGTHATGAHAATGTATATSGTTHHTGAPTPVKVSAAVVTPAMLQIKSILDDTVTQLQALAAANAKAGSPHGHTTSVHATAELTLQLISSISRIFKMTLKHVATTELQAVANVMPQVSGAMVALLTALFNMVTGLKAQIAQTVQHHAYADVLAVLKACGLVNIITMLGGQA